MDSISVSEGTQGWFHKNCNWNEIMKVIRDQDIIEVTPLAPNSLLLPCNEGVLRSI